MSQQTVTMDNPALLAALAKQAESESAKPDDRGPAPAAVPPSDSTVELPAGFLDVLTGEVLRRVEVRELNGADEEALAKAGTNFAKVVDTILERGVVSIGDRPAKPLLDMLLSGDRDALLVAVRTATYGPDLEFEATCPSCDKRQDIVIDLTSEVPTRPLEGERTFRVDLRRGQALVSLPTGRTQRELLKADGKTNAELNTMLLHACVQELHGNPVLDIKQVREGLGARDRETLLKEIAEKVPGPRLQEVSKQCRSCGESIALPLTLADLFRR